jgi:endonuclease-8
MPEGDTIFRAAGTLHRALAGSPIVRFESVFPALTRVHEEAPLTGRTVESVRSVGKHILMRFSGGLILRTHMRMNGSWHIYRPGERWRRSRQDMRVLVASPEFEAVGFNIPVAEFLGERDLARHEELCRLGPDVLSDTFEGAEAIRRIRAQGSTPIADVLLNQRVIAGLGNVYKSEVLFMCGIHPLAPVRTLDDAAMTRLVDTAHRLLQANVTGELPPMTTYAGFRRTTGRDNPRERLWVYGRSRLPCRRCGTSIQARKHGPDARLTYWCPNCQKE